MNRPAFLILLALISSATSPRAQETSPEAARHESLTAKELRVSATNLVIQFSEEGRIVAATVGPKGLARPLQAYASLAGCERVGQVVVEQHADGSMRFVQRLRHKDSRNECTLRERFLPTTNSVRWEMDISGQGEAWTTPVETHLAWPNATFPAKFWLAQSGECDADPPMHFISGTLGDRQLSWSDPLTLLSFRNLQLPYGGSPATSGFSLPLVTVIEERDDSGLMLALSPEDVPCTMTFRSDPDGRLSFARENLRIAKDRVLHLAMDWVPHEGDWRPALGWMVKRYPGFFDPPNPEATRIAGCGAFCSSYAGELDAAKLKAMGCRVNWGYGFTFPYIGMYLPYVPEGREWTSYEGRQESSRSLDELAKKWRAAGIHTLAEFVTTEWGYKSLEGQRIPPADSKANTVDAASFRDGDAWRDATRFLLEKLPGAVLFGADGKPVFSVLDVPCGNVVIDPGEPVMAEFLVDQARRFVREVPHCEGICIDRMDWLEKYNPRRDDGVSWVDGKPARSLRMSWLQIMDRLGQVLHRAGKAIFVNPHIRRLDLMRQVDGVFDEYGYLPPNNNTTAFLALHKPVMAWTPSEDYFRRDPNAFFQRYLYLGIFPMAPFPENATPVPWLHAIQPGAWAEQQYCDYGPLLDLNQGKKWVLEAHAVAVKDDLAKANIFQTPAGYVIPVVFGGATPKVTIILRKFRGLPVHFACEALHPGSGTWTPVTVSAGPSVELDVPLARGCAMVRLRPQAKSPQAAPAQAPAGPDINLTKPSN